MARTMRFKVAVVANSPHEQAEAEACVENALRQAGMRKPGEDRPPRLGVVTASGVREVESRRRTS